MTKAMVYVPYVKNRINLNNIKKGELKMNYKMTNNEYNAFIQHCSDKYFFCPLCEDFHKKIKDRESGELRGHSLCQMPIINEEGE